MNSIKNTYLDHRLFPQVLVNEGSLWLFFTAKANFWLRRNNLNIIENIWKNYTLNKLYDMKIIPKYSNILDNMKVCMWKYYT